MKNIIRSSAIILGVCAFAGKAGAQTLSNQPSQADRIVAETKKTLAKETVTTEDKKTAVVNEQQDLFQNNKAVPAGVIAPVKTEAVKLPQFLQVQ